MTFGIRLFIFLFGLILFITIFELVRRKRFREELSIIWLLTGVVLMLSPFVDLILDPLAFKLHIRYPPALAFILTFFLLVIVILYFSLVVSDLKGKNKELSQKIALIEFKLGKFYKEKEDR